MQRFGRGSGLLATLFAVLGLSAVVPDAVAKTNASPVVRSVAAASAARVGDELVYQINLRGTSNVDFGLMSSGVSRAVGEARPDARQTSQIQTIQYDLSARLHSRVIGVDARGSLVSARLQDVQYVVDGTADARQDLFSVPFTIRYGRSGKVLSFVFPDKFPGDIRLAIQRLIEPLQIVTAEPGVTAWAAEEHDADMDYTALYQVTATDPATGFVTLSKVKTVVNPRELAASNLPLPGAPSARVNRSDAVVTVDPSRQAVVSLSATESVSAFWGKSFFSDYDQTYQAVQVQVPVATLARTVVEAEALRHDVAFARARLYDVDAYTRRIVEILRLPQMMSEYRAIVVAKPGLASHQLGSWLRMNPRSALDVARQIDALDPDADSDAFGFGWAALARAGHPEAQEALLQVVTQPGWKQLSKSKAIMAMMSIEAPELSLVKALWTERSRLAGNGMAPGAEMSILTNVYGSLGDIAKGNPALTDLVVGNLARLLATRDMDSRILALDALANVGDFDRVTPLVAGALVSSEVRVRIAAFATFRRMNGDAAFATFADAFARETLPQVRLAAARVASQMAKTQARNDWATTLVARESDAKVQSELVQTLGRAIDAYPENVGTLRNLLDTTRVRAVRKDIYTYVAPVAKGGAR
jgi:hypothetical protein